MKEGKGGQLARSAGTYVQLVGKDGGFAQVKLRSGELRMIRGEWHGHDRRGIESRSSEYRDRQEPDAARWLGVSARAFAAWR